MHFVLKNCVRHLIENLYMTRRHPVVIPLVQLPRLPIDGSTTAMLLLLLCYLPRIQELEVDFGRDADKIGLYLRTLTRTTRTLPRYNLFAL